MGDLWGPMSDLWAAVVAVWDLWGIYGLLWLRSGTYGGFMGCCSCGAKPMGDLWGAVVAVPNLWGSMWNPEFHCRCVSDCIGLRCQTYGDLHCCCGCGLKPMHLFTYINTLLPLRLAGWEHTDCCLHQLHSDLGVIYRHKHYFHLALTIL